MTYETKINYELAKFPQYSEGKTGAVYGTGPTEDESINEALKVFSSMGKFPHQVLGMETKKIGQFGWSRKIETKETI